MMAILRFLILTTLFTTILAFAQAEPDLKNVAGLYHFQSEDSEVLNEKGGLDQHQFEIFIATPENENEFTATLNWLKSDLANEKSRNPALESSVTVIDSTGNDRAPQSIDPGKLDLEKAAEEIAKNGATKTKVKIPLKTSSTFNTLREAFITHQKPTLFLTRFLVNGAVVAWMTYMAHDDVPLSSCIMLGLEMGGFSAGMMLINPFLQKFLVTSYVIKSRYGITREEFLKHVETYKQMIEKRKAGNVLKESELGFLKKMNKLKLISRSEEFVKWFSLEATFIGLMDTALFFHGIDPALGANIGNTVLKGLGTAGMSTIAQAPWELAIAKKTEERLLAAEAEYKITGDLAKLNLAKREIQAFSNLRIVGISVLSVTGAAAHQLGVPFAKAGLFLLSVSGWYQYLKLDYKEQITKFKNNCGNFFKKFLKVGLHFPSKIKTGKTTEFALSFYYGDSSKFDLGSHSFCVV